MALIPELKAINGIDPEIEAHIRLITSVKYTVPMHTHDFYEFFIILKGKVVHCVNGEKQLLHENSLVFIRERDVHCYEYADGEDCQFINVSFYKDVLDSLFLYLGEGFPKESLLSPLMPPTVLLSELEKEYMQNRLEKLNLIPKSRKSLIKAKTRALIVELFSKYLMEEQELYPDGIPVWMTRLCALMKEKENFVEGVRAMVRISGKTHSYLCRSFKKYVGMTPVEYINNARLTYAENLLLNTDRPIIEICMEAGFENLSNFYERFRERLGTTPQRYRKSHQDNRFYF